jgi:integrase
MPAKTTTPTTAENVTGSLVETPEIWLARNRVSVKLTARPITIPTATRRRPPNSTRRKIFDLADLCRDAKIKKGHAHRMRDTFAVELLLAGVPLERVSILLGHTSVKVTERHYSPWIRERQEQAEADVKRTWAHDPIALLETKGTPGVHQ